MAKSRGPKLPELPQIDTSGRVKNTKPKRATSQASRSSPGGRGKRKEEKPGFKVREEDRQEFRRLVQRANRTLKSNLEYVKTNKIKDLETKRDLVMFYDKKRNWMKNRDGKRGKSPLSRSISFKDEKAYKEYVHHLKDIVKGGTANKKTKGYKETILDRLQRIADIHSVQLPDGKLGNVLKEAVEGMTLPQLRQWFTIGDPSEDMEVSQYGSDDFMGVDSYNDFAATALKRISWIKKAY